MTNASAGERGQFRKKPVVIEAWQVGSSEPKPDWLRVAHVKGQLFGNGYDYYEIKTLEGTMRADPRDWIIQGIKGELYPCKPDIFAATYEPAARKSVDAAEWISRDDHIAAMEAIRAEYMQRLLGAQPTDEAALAKARAIDDVNYTADDWAREALAGALRDTWSESDPDESSLDTIVEQLASRGFKLAPIQSVAAGEEVIKSAVTAGNNAYWADAKARSDEAFTKWHRGDVEGVCPQISKGSIIDYITRAVLSALANAPSAEKKI